MAKVKLSDYIGAAVFTIISIGLLSHGWDSIKSSNKTYNWDRVQGKIISSSIQKGKRFYLEIQYEYQVDSKRFESNQWAHNAGISFDTHEKATQFVSKYHPGQTVLVYFDPSSPSKSVLRSGITLEGFITGILGMLALIPPLLVMVKALKSSRSTKGL